MEEGSVQVSHAALFDGMFQFVRVVCEFYAVVLHDVAGSAHRSGSVISVLGYPVTGSGHDKAGTCGDVEGVFPSPPVPTMSMG